VVEERMAAELTLVVDNVVDMVLQQEAMDEFFAVRPECLPESLRFALGAQP
jgi:hypothetical protein